MRGDRPGYKCNSSQRTVFTPHARGSTPTVIIAIVEVGVYPACAGIDRCSCSSVGIMSSLPRMRGDRPPLLSSKERFLPFTPHARGSTVIEILEERGITVYPACAGIDLVSTLTSGSRVSLPRMRGDRPYTRVRKDVARRFTPHARGSTEAMDGFFHSGKVYPACAGIDPGRTRTGAFG